MFLYTRHDVVRKITRDRVRIADQLTHAIMKALSERDLINGYKKE